MYASFPISYVRCVSVEYQLCPRPMYPRTDSCNIILQHCCVVVSRDYPPLAQLASEFASAKGLAFKNLRSITLQTTATGLGHSLGIDRSR
jgi:hypothetical protein